MPNQHLEKENIYHKVKTGRWSKYGGAIRGLEKEHLDRWACQACGEEQTDKLPAYMFEIWPGEFIRICAKCQNTARVEHIEEFQVLKVTVKRKPFGF